MRPKPLTLEQRSELLNKRLSKEITYEDAIEIYDLRPSQYPINIRMAVEYMIETGASHKVIDDLFVFDKAREERQFSNIADENVFCSLFDMSEKTINESYLRVLAGAPKLIPGLQISPKNGYTLLKVTFNHHFPGFCEMERDEQIRIIDAHIKATYDKSNDNGIGKWLNSHGLAGFLNQGVYSSDRSPFKLLKWFDEKISKEKKQSSWFNLTKAHHLHVWEFRRDWSNDNTTYWAIKHCIEENIPPFKNASREDQLKLIEGYIFSKGYNMKKRSRKFFEECGLSGMLRQRFKYSVDAVEFFDRRYSKEKGQASYFDRNEKVYLEREKYDNTSDRLKAVEAQEPVKPQPL